MIFLEKLNYLKAFRQNSTAQIGLNVQKPKIEAFKKLTHPFKGMLTLKLHVLTFNNNQTRFPEIFITRNTT